MEAIFSLMLITALCAVTGCAGLPGGGPELKWDARADQVVIEAYAQGVLLPPGYAENEIPGRVWGDGRVIWDESTPGGGRRVLVGQLTPEQMTALLTRFRDAGYFRWAETYEPESPVMDGGVSYLQVHLTGTNRSVAVFAGGNPPAGYADLYRLITTGAGTAGQDLPVPERVFLKVYPAGGAGDGNTPVWPDERFGPLAGVGEGKWIEGEAAAFAWETVNTRSYAVVQSGGEGYWLVAQVPGVTQYAPEP